MLQEVGYRDVLGGEGHQRVRRGQRVGVGGAGASLRPAPRTISTATDKLPTVVRKRRILWRWVRRITLVGAIYLSIVAILPEFIMVGFKVAPIPLIGEQLDAMLPRFVTQGLNVQFFFGGTSLLIVVGVAMDTVNQVESQLIMRHYDGFMKKTRIRGRRG